MLRLDIFGYRYDDEEPAFFDCGPTFWWHRPTETLLTKVSVTAFMNSFTPHKAMDAKEHGQPSAAWLANHPGVPVAAAAPPPPVTTGTLPSGITVNPVTGLPITGDTAGTKKVDLDINMHGKPISTAATATITYDVGAGDVTFTQAITANDAGHAIMVAIAANAGWATGGMAATCQGTTITVTPNDGVTLSKLTLTFA